MRSYNKKQIIIVSSITYAYKARDFLFNKNIKCHIQRVPANLRVNGCGYGVTVEGDAQAISLILKDAGIKVKEILTL